MTKINTQMPAFSVVVGSANPVKLAATQQAFSEVFPDRQLRLSSESVASGVSDQPLSDAETLQGALNRALRCRERQPEADFWVGLEGGCQPSGAYWEAFAWMVVLGKDRLGQAKTATLVLPPAIGQLVQQGMELGEADDQVFGQKNSKQKSGAIGLLTKGVIDRQAYYAHTLVLALVPFIHPEYYPDSV